MFLVLCALVIAALGGLVHWMRSCEIKGIPEPAGNYALGHVFLLGGNFCKTLLKWNKVVGPVFQLRFFGVRVVVFNDRESIARICALHETTGRARTGFFKMGFEIIGEGVANSEGPVWAEQRQFIVKSLRTFGVGRPETERSLQEEIAGTLKDWEDQKGAPFVLQGCSTNFVFNALWNVLASTRIENSKISYLSHHMEMMTKMDTLGHKAVTFSTNFVGKFTNALKEKIQAFQGIADFARDSVMEHQKDRIPNEPRDVLDQMLDKMDATTDVSSAFHKRNLKNGFAVGEIIAATLDTTSRTLEWLMFYLAWRPELASKLHAEIDRVFEGDLESWPSLADREKMPYAQACILEALRIGSVFPFGVPHKALEDFEFDGAIIPKGTILVMNLYGAQYDPQVWDEPEEFQPERFLTPEGDKIDLRMKNNIAVFGFGRRVCPGNHIALDSMFLYVVNAYRKFRFEMVGHVASCEGRFGFVLYPPKDVQLRAINRFEN